MEHVLQVDVVSVSILLGSVIPFIVGLVTKKYASSAVKVAANVVLCIAGAALATIVQADGAVTLGQLVTSAFAALTSSGVLYTSVYKPAGLTAKVQNIAPSAGLGKPVVPPLASTLVDATPETPVPVSNAITPPGPAARKPSTLQEARDLADSSVLTDGSGFFAWIVPVEGPTD
jgi:hypothetical protein